MRSPLRKREKAKRKQAGRPRDGLRPPNQNGRFAERTALHERGRSATEMPAMRDSHRWRSESIVRNAILFPLLKPSGINAAKTDNFLAKAAYSFRAAVMTQKKSSRRYLRELN